MTRELLNTLFIQTQDARASLENETVKVKLGDETLLRVPLHHLGSICVFGVVHVTSPLMMKCAEEGRSLVFFDHGGRFKARVTGKTGGNILLRTAQWSAAFDPNKTLDLARSIVSGKVQNSRFVLLRARRDTKSEAFDSSIECLESVLAALPEAKSVDYVRGQEGFAAEAYFSVFDSMILTKPTEFAFSLRSRRPPRDRMNALLSFVYSLATSECASALEGVGLDPQLGFLHVTRPGRPSLALDLIEEFRSVLLDRFCLTAINRKQVVADDFQEFEGGGVLLSADGRRKVLGLYQQRKQDEVQHDLFIEKVPIGMLPHIQARVLARTLRGDIPHYLPYVPS
jgi:CRISP-associated protein Cas1